MKTPVSIYAIMLVMLMACSKDQFLPDEQFLQNETKVAGRAKVPIPMKADFCFTPDMTLYPVHIDGLPWDNADYYLPGGGWLSGHATHMGEIIMSESPMTITSAVFDGTNNIITWQGSGKVTAANGDYYMFNTVVYQNPDKSFTGSVYMYDGTGKFEGATGTVQMVGEGTCWTASGFLEYDK